MFEIGLVCRKTAGAERGKLGVVVDGDGKKDSSFVLLDGNVKRKRCNIAHLEPAVPREILKIKKGAASKEVLSAMKKVGLKVEVKKEVEKKVKEKKVKRGKGLKKK